MIRVSAFIQKQTCATMRFVRFESVTHSRKMSEHGSPKEGSPGGKKSLNFRDPTTSQLGGGSSLLRKRKEDKTPFGAAAKAMGAVVSLGKRGMEKVTKFDINTIADAVGMGEKKKDAGRQMTPAPVAVTQSYSIMLTHAVAPLWSVGPAKPLGVLEPINYRAEVVVSFASALDQKGWDLDTVAEALDAVASVLGGGRPW